MTDYWEDTNAFLAKVGWEVRSQADNFMVKDCPYCNDGRWKLGISKDRPVWKCHHCEEIGNLRQLAEKIGLSTGYIVSAADKAYIKPEGINSTVAKLKDFPTVIAYLKKKGLTGEIAHRFRLGAEHEHHEDWLVIPHIVNGEILNAKYRSTTGDKKFRRYAGAKSILFNQGSINEKEVLITEGEMDCISVNAAYGDGHAVVAATGGAKHFAPEWIDLLARTKKIYLCYDRDETGQVGVKDVARRLGYARCWNIILPEGYNDINDLFAENPSDFKIKFEGLKANAKRFDIQGIQSAESLLHDVFATQETDKNVSPWKSLNRLVDIRPGHLVVLTAEPKAGKTSMVLEWFRHRVNIYGEPVLFYCLDMRPTTIVEKVCKLEFDVSSEELLQNRTEYQEKASSYFSSDPKWYMCGKSWDNYKDYFKLIRASIPRYGFRWICFDHFHKLIQSLNHTVQEQSNIAREFKRLAEETETTVVLIAQPRKRGGREPEGMLTARDLSGSAILSAEADHVITLTRKRVDADMEGEMDASFVPETWMRVDMSRWASGGGKPLYFHGHTQKFTDPPDNDILEPNDQQKEEKEEDPFA